MSGTWFNLSWSVQPLTQGPWYTDTHSSSSCSTMNAFWLKVPNQSLHLDLHTYTDTHGGWSFPSPNLGARSAELYSHWWTRTGKTSVLVVCDKPLLLPYSSISPSLFLSKLPKLFPFPTFVSFPKNPTRSPWHFSPYLVLLCIPYPQTAPLTPFPQSVLQEL